MPTRHPVPSPPPVPDAKRAQRIAWFALNSALIVLALWVIRDFLVPIVWAGVITIALWPLLLRVASPRHSPAGAAAIALLLTLGVGLFVALPILFVFAQTVREAHDLIAWIKQAEASGIAVPGFLAHVPFGEQIAQWWDTNLAHGLRGSPAVEELHGPANVVKVSRRFGLVALHSLLHFGFMLLTLFVLLKAGPRLADQSRKGVRRMFGSSGEQLAVRMAAAVRGTVTGLVVVGLGEGVLIGIVYVLTGVPHAAALGLLTAVAAMVPFCAPVVFGAAGLWLFAQGDTGGAVAVLATGSIVVFVAEHFVRPLLIGSAARLPFLLVLFGILGGAQTFGFIGLFIGPSLMTALVVMWRESAR
ncbi:AI-2E family transporter [Trinickia caryophylli]|uniref:Predicted PurR-regulated permease PerM n=1 Tax=Trinickia caryophylli TaxID=28094 RepID=A0A1X7CV57_TRICW|nr:AI-2E family transporter [Trinickia caryophylli]PMS13407.1 AI-2E family transporter [Trinickia caryophylli]TRX13733.1 AI-2E family transporter [Trinickia caryophylli]SMF03755.1 Predicted PurR-regulated permease PerM [Trinickia caryophylli]